ncbi:glycosyl transferase family 2 [Methylovorus sp. MP688]|nr:glycosyl transferase family 2 [Methylovorus sp. MP688]
MCVAKFDVLMPVKNGEAFIREAIDSVINQTEKNWRLLVLDHGSSDETLNIVNALIKVDKRIELYSFPDAVGLSGLLNEGLKICNAEYVMRLDSDDVALPSRMELTERAFLAHPDITVVGGQALKIDGTGKSLGKHKVAVGVEAISAAIFFYNPVIHPTVSMRLSHIQQEHIRYGEDFLKCLPNEDQIHVPSLAEDYFLFGLLAISKRCLNLDEPLILYRWHGQNVSISKAVDQRKVALQISQYLAKNAAIRYQIPLFDPVPYSNHGCKLESDAKWGDTADQLFDALSGVIDKGSVERERAFRKAIFTNNILTYVLKYACFRLRYREERTDETVTFKHQLKKRLVWWKK